MGSWCEMWTLLICNTSPSVFMRGSRALYLLQNTQIVLLLRCSQWLWYSGGHRSKWRAGLNPNAVLASHGRVRDAVMVTFIRKVREVRLRPHQVLRIRFQLLSFSFVSFVTEEQPSSRAHWPCTMPIRNPFAKRADPLLNDGNTQHGTTGPTFEKLDGTGSIVSLPLSISSKHSQEPPEYKMSGMSCDMHWIVGDGHWMIGNRGLTSDL